MYKVIPFNAAIANNAGADAAAAQLEAAIVGMAQHNFEYVRMELIPTFVAGTNGCFGIGAKPSSNRQYPVLIFRQR